MPTYLTPGVYVEEVPSTSKPIEGVGTSIAAFVGLAPGGPVNTPMRISNWTQFAKIFGDPNEPDNGPFMEGAYLAHSVYGFFQNGGGLCWVVRVGAGDGAGGASAGGAARRRRTSRSRRSAPRRSRTSTARVKVELTEEPSAPARARASRPTSSSSTPARDGKEEYEGLTLKKGAPEPRDQGQRRLQVHQDHRGRPACPTRRPAAGTYTLSAPSVVGRGRQGDRLRGRRRPPPGHGRPGGRRRDHDGLHAGRDDARRRAATTSQLRDLQGKMIAHCEGAGDRMAILDAPPNLLPQEILEWRMNTAGYDSKFATLYYPWIEVMDPLTNQPMLVPPSGHVAGVWCRTDASRGVHKAPANEVVMGVNGLGFQVTQGEQGGLNKVGINCIRSFPGRGIRIWGARTLSSDPEWRYINVRRLFNYIAESIMEGTQWSVFEPNDERLWMQLRIAASNFLTRTWREGALFGATPEQAFFVKCDAETNPPEVIEAGQVICEIGIAPVKPAEFVVFRLSQFSAGAAEVE